MVRDAGDADGSNAGESRNTEAKAEEIEDTARNG